MPRTFEDSAEGKTRVHQSGVREFGESLRRAGYDVVEVDWSPHGGGRCEDGGAPGRPALESAAQSDRHLGQQESQTRRNVHSAAPRHLLDFDIRPGNLLVENRRSRN